MYKYCVLGFLFLLSTVTLSQIPASLKKEAGAYVLFQKEYEHQLELLRSKTEKPYKYEKVLAEIPPDFFDMIISDSSFVSFGISDPLIDTTLAYNMATGRALLMANVFSGTDLNVFYTFFSNEKSFGKTGPDARFSQFYVVSNKHYYTIKHPQQKLINFRLSSGETIVIAFSKDIVRQQSATNIDEYKFNIWISEYQHLGKYEPVSRININSPTKSDDFASYVYSSSGKLSMAYTLANGDSITNNNTFFIYKNTNAYTVDSSFSSYPLHEGFWTAYVNTLTNEIIKLLPDAVGNMFSGMTDNYNNSLKSYSQSLDTNIRLKLKLQKLEMIDNDLFLKTSTVIKQ